MEDSYDSPEAEIVELRGRITAAWEAFQADDMATVQMILSCPFGGHIVALDGLALADIKAIFASDGTFSVDPR